MGAKLILGFQSGKLIMIASQSMKKHTSWHEWKFSIQIIIYYIVWIPRLQGWSHKVLYFSQIQSFQIKLPVINITKHLTMQEEHRPLLQPVLPDEGFQLNSIKLHWADTLWQAPHIQNLQEPGIFFF